MSKQNTASSKDKIFAFICTFGILSSFSSIYQYAHKAQAWNAVWAGGLMLMFFTFLLATKLTNLRTPKK